MNCSIEDSFVLIFYMEQFLYHLLAQEPCVMIVIVDLAWRQSFISIERLDLMASSQDMGSQSLVELLLV